MNMPLMLSGKFNLFKALALFALLFPSWELLAQTAVYPGNGSIYDGAVHRIDLIMAADTLTDLLKEENRWTNHSYRVTMVYDRKDTIRNVGLRIKGNSSRRAVKQSFKIETDEFVNQDYQGLKTFNLNGSHNDPSLIREYLSARVMNMAKIPCLRANPVVLYMNGTYYGVYTNSEHYGKTFLTSRFGSSAGNFYKCSWPADLVWIDGKQSTYKGIINPSPLNERAYELKTNEGLDDYTDLVNLIRVIHTNSASAFAKALDSVFDIQAYLKVLAAEVLIGQWDNYFYNKNNYFLYHDPMSGKFVYLPYDLDNTFGVEWGVPDINKRNIHAWGNLQGSKAPLTHKLLAIPEYKRAYEGYVRSLVDSVFNEVRLFPVIDTLRARLDPWVKKDPWYSGVWTSDYGYTYSDWTSSFTKGTDDHSKFGVKPYITDRAGSAKTQFIFPVGIPTSQTTGVQVYLYPNPASGSFHVTVPGSDMMLSVMDVRGEMQFSQVLRSGENEISIEDLPSGTYVFMITGKGGLYRGRLMVH